MGRPTDKHGTPPELLRCELGARGPRPVDFAALAPADGYRAAFASSAALPPVAVVTPCRRRG